MQYVVMQTQMLSSQLLDAEVKLKMLYAPTPIISAPHANATTRKANDMIMNEGNAKVKS